MLKVLKYIDKIDFKSTSEYLLNYFLIRGRSWIEAAPNWPKNIFWLDAAAINGAATVTLDHNQILAFSLETKRKFRTLSKF